MVVQKQPRVKWRGSPTICQPTSAARESVRGMLRQAWMGRYSRAPALALLAAGDSGAELRPQQSTPATPRKYATLTAAPRFCCRHTRAHLFACRSQVQFPRFSQVPAILSAATCNPLLKCKRKGAPGMLCMQNTACSSLHCRSRIECAK